LHTDRDSQTTIFTPPAHLPIKEKVQSGSPSVAEQRETLLENMRPYWDRKARWVFQKIDTDQNDLLEMSELWEWAAKNQDAAKGFLPPLETLEDWESSAEWMECMDQTGDLRLNVGEFSELYVSAMSNCMAGGCAAPPRNMGL